MAEASTIARPYAQAVFSLARDENSYQNWSDTLALLAAVVREPKFAAVVGNPKIPAAKVIELFISVCGDKLPKLGANFIKVLVNSGRVTVAPEIAEIFNTLRSEAEKSINVEIISAQALNEDQKRNLSSSLRKRLNRDVELDCRVDDSLIGGAIVRAGDQVIDGSVSGQLSRLVSQVI